MRWNVVAPVVASFLVAGLSLTASSHASAEDLGQAAETTQSSGDSRLVGLSLWFQDGLVRKQDYSPKVTPLIGNPRRYIQELDITAAVTTTTDQGIEPLKQQGDMKTLSWTGVHMVEERWRPAPDGTFIRQRFYRDAAWMSAPSIFIVLPLNDNGDVVGLPIFSNAGFDNLWTAFDDGFVRRFDARQITFGCTAIGNCAGATQFVAEGLAQFRNALHPELWAMRIPGNATQLGVLWSADPSRLRKAPVVHRDRADVQWGYGFEPRIEAVNPPANGIYYTPGESLDLRLSFFDGEGNRLFPQGSMPTYDDFMRDAIPSGLRYYDGFREVLELYYALKHREGNLLVNVSGPMDQLRLVKNTVPQIFDLFAPQTIFADADADGFTSIATLHPPAAQQLPGGTTLPVSDVVHFVVPANAKPGTYLAVVKARRDYGGEALNRTGQLQIQVGQATASPPTTFKTGNCGTCHQGRTGLGEILHGGGDRRACFGCHPTLGFEEDHALDCRVHTVHTRSRRVPGNVNDCSTCHLQTPPGPPRCFTPQ